MMSRTQEVVTLEALRARRAAILQIAARHGASNVRVFGSVARGEADSDSDIDLLVDFDSNVRGFAYFGAVNDMREELASILGRDVDVVRLRPGNPACGHILREAVPL